MTDNVMWESIKDQYLSDGEKSFDDVLDRVTKFLFKDSTLPKKERDFITEALHNRFISVNSPLLMNAGKSNVGSACFIIDVEDSVKSIFSSVEEAALIQKQGAGVGLSFSNLRGNGEPINSTGGTSSGVLAWMSIFNATVEGVKQGGRRRGALLIALPINHPDIEDFVDSKTPEYYSKIYGMDINVVKDNWPALKPFKNMNISVMLSDEFMRAVSENKDFDLISPSSKKIVKTVKAKRLFDKIINNMYYYGDPGIFFDDVINSKNPTPIGGKIRSSNPCVSGDTKLFALRQVDGKTTKSSVCTIKELAEENEKYEVFGYTYSYNKTSRNIELKKFINPRKTVENDDIYRVTLENNSFIEVNNTHKFFFDDNSEKEVKDLKTGDKVLFFTRDSREIPEDGITAKDAKVSSFKITSIEFIGKKDVYNITVEDNHTVAWITDSKERSRRYFLEEPFIDSGFLSPNCGELLTFPYTSCNLVALNLSAIMEKIESFNKPVDDLKVAIYPYVKAAVYTANSVIEKGNFILDKVAENTKKYRFIGIGIMDLATCMLRDQIRYGDNEKAVSYTENLFKAIKLSALEASIEATEYFGRVKKELVNEDTLFMGFPAYKSLSVYQNFQEKGIANSTLLSVAPTGATGLLMGANAGGIEPIFSYKYTRNIRGKDTEMVVPEWNSFIKKHPDENLPDYFVTTKDLSPDDHYAIQKAASKYVDLAISKTINLSQNDSPDTVSALINKAWNERIVKGMTIFNPYAEKMAILKLTQAQPQKKKRSVVIERGTIVEGETRKLEYHGKKIYITINYTPKKNEPVECFISAGDPDSGELQSLLWSLGWFISNFWKYNLPSEKMFSKMMNLKSFDRIISGNKIYSGLVEMIFSQIYDSVYSRTKDLALAQTCPSCNEKSLISESGCWKCLRCGYSKC